MGRVPCCEKVGLKRGRWTAEEDEILRKYIEANGEGSWRSLPTNAGLLRCGKSCRLRWINYLRSDLKRGNISAEEEEIIINLHASMGNRWSLIAGHLPGRTDNEIKNYWNSHLSRKIHSFRRPNSHFTALAVASAAAATKKKKTRGGKKSPKASTKTEENNGELNSSAVPMPTTPTPEKEAFSRTTLWKENNGGNGIPMEEGMKGTENIDEGMGMEYGTLSLEEMMENLGGILGLEEGRENGGIVRGSGLEGGSENGEWNSWEWEWGRSEAWGQEENTFPWILEGDSVKGNSCGLISDGLEKYSMQCFSP